MKLIHIHFIKRDADERYSDMKVAQAVQPQVNGCRKINVAKSPVKLSLLCMLNLQHHLSKANATLNIFSPRDVEDGQSS